MKNIFQTKKKWIIAFFVLILMYGIWHFIKNRHLSTKVPQDSVVVEVEKVKQGKIPLQGQAVGALVAARNVQLTSEVAGQVATILVRDGAFVKQGTPLIQLDDAVNKAKAESAKANLTFSEANYNRMHLLIKKGAVSQQAVDQALANLKEKKAIEKETRVLAEKMLIIAPFDGALGKIKVNPGEHVTVGQPLVSLTDTKNLRVEFNISEKYLAKVKMGQQVTLTTTSYPGKEFYGKVSFIAPTINTEDRTISIYADVPNQDGVLTAGLFVNVVHLMGEESNVMLIPSVSLVATIDGQQVFKVVNAKAVAVPVKIGLRTTNQVQVTQGLTSNDLVIVSGQHKIKDGAAIKLKS